jgi:selenocysteine-specific elongation factor
MRHIIAGTAGHIDHGKSALVQALTGTDPDRLKEEKIRGITIDLGFAHLDLGDLQVGIVDVPGHERFVKNMLAGVGGIDLVLLVVAADESVMPQTREHFDICKLLGVNSGIVVISKTDLVEPELLDLVREEISDTVKGSFLEGAEVIPVSSRTGQGIDALKQAIRLLSTRVPQRPTQHLLRLPIDRAFTVRGFGTVVTGTLTTGEIRKEQEVELVPGGLTARVRGIQVHGTMSERAVAGQRTAVNLPGIDLSQAQRGIVLTVPRLFRATQLLDVRLELLKSARPLRTLIKVRFHHGTSEVLARVALLGEETLHPGRAAYAQLRLDTPVFALCGDPFILRQFSPTITIGGGRVLNPHPQKHKATDAEALKLLGALSEAAGPDRIPILLSMHGSRAVDTAGLNALLGIPEAELRTLCATLEERGDLVVINAPVPLVMLPPVLKSLETETVSLIGGFHRQNTLLKGIPREELRKKLFDDLPADVFRFCLDRLAAARRIAVQEETVSAYGREVQLSPEAQRVRDQVEAILLQSGYQPPALSELPACIQGNPDEIRRVSFWLIKQKVLVKVGEDLTYHRVTLEDMKKKIQANFVSGARFGVAEFKSLLDISRKHAIPLLEYLDRERFTRREGNDRVLL